jgi:hypothetical protein
VNLKGCGMKLVFQIYYILSQNLTGVTEGNYFNARPPIYKQDCKHCNMQYKKPGYPLFQKYGGATEEKETKLKQLGI